MLFACIKQIEVLPLHHRKGNNSKKPDVPHGTITKTKKMKTTEELTKEREDIIESLRAEYRKQIAVLDAEYIELAAKFKVGDFIKAHPRFSRNLRFQGRITEVSVQHGINGRPFTIVYVIKCMFHKFEARNIDEQSYEIELRK